MKTVQSYLREADRKIVLDMLCDELICDPLFLLENKDRTIAEIQATCRIEMNSFLDHLLTIEAKPSENLVLYLIDDSANYGMTMNLVNLDEIRKDIYAPCYVFELEDWSTSLGFLVAENTLTQENIEDLLVQYLNTVSVYGMDPEIHKEKCDRILLRLSKTVRNEEPLPISYDADDAFADGLWSQITQAKQRLESYYHWRERSLILTTLGDEVPQYEHDRYPGLQVLPREMNR